MRFKEFIVSMFSDAESGGISSKRVIGFASFIVFISLAYINTYTGARTPEVFVDGLMFIILGAFLGGTLEYFSKRQPSTTVKTGDNTDVTVNEAPQATTNKPVAAPQPVVPPIEGIVPADTGKIVETEIVNKNIPE